MSDSDEQPMVRFGGDWIPAHDVWKKMETATVVVDHIDRFNSKFPHLASGTTRDVVPLVRQRLKDVELYMPRKIEYPDIAPEAVQMLATASPEDVIDALAEMHDMSVSLDQLIQIAGEKAYLGALNREGLELMNNRVSPEQTAQLWNELQRPAPGGGMWSAKKVEELLSRGIL
ncbi:MAG: hypothetical protein KDJ27_16375 [Gammaproteobacteria bacterium]|nr:hypothetical protein [Gammaproteobacteria bacterium]MCB1925292.1 hypothetical protein [Gammaproteobacteria bacterium]